MTAQAIIHDSIDAAVRRRAREHADDIAVVDPYRYLTWSDLDAAADRLAATLAAQGVGRGDRVAWLGPNVAAYPITLLAAWRRGASIVGLNLRLPAADLAAMTQAVRPAHLVYEAHYSELAAALDVPGRTVVAPDDEMWPPIVSAGDAGVDRAAIDTDADDEALIYFTSGSTGHPKAVPLTRGAIEATLPYAAVHRFNENSRALVIPPNFHAAGATWANYGMYIGMRLVYIADTSPAGIADAIVEHGITHILMVPTLIHSLLGELREHPRALPSLQHVGYGASSITQQLLGDAIGLLGCEFAQVYGLSETGGGVAFLEVEDHLGDHPERLSSAGRPGAGIDVEVRGPDGSVLAAGESGELWFRSPCVTRGYLDNPDATARVLVDGWFNTRDIGFLDDDGYLYVQGRSDDMICTGGENVHPQVVEEVLAAMPGVEECAVFGAPDPHWGQRVCVAVVATEPISDVDVIAWCTERLGGFQVPKSVVFLDELPRTATGKVKRSALSV